MNEDIEILTDEFLQLTLHYELGSGKWNKGDGHCWIFNKDNADEVYDYIVYRFKYQLKKLFEQNRLSLRNDNLYIIKYRNDTMGLLYDYGQGLIDSIIDLNAELEIITPDDLIKEIEGNG